MSCGSSTAWRLCLFCHACVCVDSVVYDFAGPYTIGRDSFAFGIPTRYVQCSVKRDDADKWDDAVAKGCAVYETRMHNLWYAPPSLLVDAVSHDSPNCVL